MLQLLPLAMAALVTGTAANMVAQRRQRKALGRAHEDYARRTDQRTAEAKALFEKSLGEQNVGTQAQRVDAAAAEKTQRVDDLVARESSYITPMLPGQGTAPRVIQSQAASSMADELARARAQIAALAKLEGFSTRTFDRGLELDAVKPQLGNLALFAEGDRNILSARLAAAARKGEKTRMFGDLLTGMGQMGLSAGMGGGMNPAGMNRVLGAAQPMGGGPSLNPYVGLV